MDRELVRRQVVFQGRVQGVGFRATARHTARSRPVSGWVRNQPDGSVLLEVQGSAAAVEEYLGALRQRMAGLISGEDAVAMDVLPGEQEFEVRR